MRDCYKIDSLKPFSEMTAALDTLKQFREMQVADPFKAYREMQVADPFKASAFATAAPIDRGHGRHWPL